MNDVLAPVIELLREQKKLHEDVLDLSGEKRQVIVKGETERLNEIVRLEMKAVARFRTLEKKRAAALSGAAAEAGVPAEGLTMTMLIDMAQGGEREELNVLQKELRSLVEAQSELNRMNKELLEAHLEYTDTMLEVLVGAEDPINNFYDGAGRSEYESRRTAGLFDKQI